MAYAFTEMKRSNAIGHLLAAAALCLWAVGAVAVTPAANATLPALSGTTVSAIASDPGGSVSKVEFYAGTILIGTSTSAPYSTSWTPGAAGTYVLTARATDSEGEIAVSAGVSVNVVANVAPTVNLTSPTNNAVFAAPGAFTLSATASDSDGSITKVAFFQGATLLATVTSPPIPTRSRTCPRAATAIRPVGPKT